MSGDGDVLDTLVKQFTDPLACLRELIQNAVDAGSDVVEVRAFRDGEYGVLEVQDHGEGMDKAIIEQKLVRLFASNKDGDLTKIGKFGIGFVSVFALDPVIVCVDTARAGERWRVLFHRDRTWTRAALDEPMEGTRVRLYLERDPAGFARLARDAEAAVRKWCRFLEAEVLFEGEAINEPLALKGCHLTARHDDGAGTVVIVGLGGDGTVGFYNKGLTLLEASTWPDLPAGVSVLLSSRWLEHTLTRDSIVKDSHYAKAIAVARRLIDDELEPAARAALVGAPAERRSALWAWLANRADRRLRKEAFLIDVTGKARAPRDLQKSPPFVVLAGSPSADKVGAAVAATGAVVLPVNAGHTDGDRDSLAALIECQASALVDVEQAFVAAEPVDAARAARAARLAEHTAGLLSAAGERHGVVVARLMGAQCRSRLAFVVDAAFALRTDGPTAVATTPPPPARLGRRATTFVVDIDHADFQPLLELAATQTALAALLLARLLLPAAPTEKTNTALTTAAWTLHAAGGAR
jgi:molecular chaperone HtpG